MASSYKYICESVNTKTVVAFNKRGCSSSRVLNADHLRAQMDRRGVSQSELARRIGVSQQNIGFLLSGKANGSKHLHRIARELQTTAAYLAGEIDDPDEGAPPPAPPPPPVQLVNLAVALPSEPVLAQLFEAVLIASPRLQGAELAHELARRLPTLLSLGRLPLAGPIPASGAGGSAAAAAPAGDRHEPKRARRT